MTAILTRMSQGFPGDITRQSQNTIEAQVGNSSLPFPAYGVPGKIVSNAFVPIAAGDAATAIYGILVRPFPTQGANASDPLGTAVPATGGVKDVLKRGYVAVKCNNGTPAINGTVYVRVAAASGAKVIGGIEAASDSTNTVVMANAIFTGNEDASGNAEIAYNI
jgi:hypothetical protein